MLEGLREERNRVSEAIVVLERLAAGNGGKRRGRPPKWMQEIQEGEKRAEKKAGKKGNGKGKGTDKPNARTHHRFSASTRRKMAAAQRRRWKLVRKGSTA